MKTTGKVPQRARQHTPYFLRDGTRVPGVTTVTGVLDKPALVVWANNLGLQGIRVGEYVDELAAIGTLTHMKIAAYLKGEDPDKVGLQEFTKDQLNQADTCLIKFWDWEKGHKLVTILAEEPIISERHRAGGTPDWFGLLDDIPTLLDFKTAKGIFPEHLLQASAYFDMLREIGHAPEQARIIRVGRNEMEGFEDRTVGNIPRRIRLFELCREVYELQKELAK